jgi:hypothetical protein
MFCSGQGCKPSVRRASNNEGAAIRYYNNGKATQLLHTDDNLDTSCHDEGNNKDISVRSAPHVQARARHSFIVVTSF